MGCIWRKNSTLKGLKSCYKENYTGSCHVALPNLRWRYIVLTRKFSQSEIQLQLAFFRFSDFPVCQPKPMNHYGSVRDTVASLSQNIKAWFHATSLLQGTPKIINAFAESQIPLIHTLVHCHSIGMLWQCITYVSSKLTSRSTCGGHMSMTGCSWCSFMIDSRNKTKVVGLGFISWIIFHK